MELSWESSKNFSKYRCTIKERDIEYVEKEVNLLFEKYCNFFFAIYWFHLLWKNKSAAGKIWSVTAVYSLIC